MTAVLRSELSPEDPVERARRLLTDADRAGAMGARWDREAAEGPPSGRREARRRARAARRRAAAMRAEAEDILLLAWRADGDAEVDRLLARTYRIFHERAEGEGREDDAARWALRVLRHDVDGVHARWLAGEGRVDLHTEPAGIPVDLEVRSEDGAVGRRRLGVTPLQGVSVPAGAHTLIVQAPSGDIPYPIQVGREGHWIGPTLPLPELVPEGFRVIPGGAFRYGGDDEGDYPLPESTPTLPTFAIATYPVTLAEYCAFLNDRLATDREDALLRVPRRVAPGGARALLRADPTRAQAFDPADLDPLGRHDIGRHAVTGISHADAEAFAAWKSARDGVVYRLPSERQWEKAARGVDGRLFPWGDEFDPSLCHMRYTFAGRPHPRPVGTVPGDVSPYGVRDLAGGVLEWCRPGDDPLPGGGNPIRGGCWHSSTRPCRAADRFGAGPNYVDPALGFRLVVEFPR